MTIFLFNYCCLQINFVKASLLLISINKLSGTTNSELVNGFSIIFLFEQQVFDNLMKRISYRRQKRWWNAYLLFYTRLDQEEDEFSALLVWFVVVGSSSMVFLLLVMYRMNNLALEVGVGGKIKFAV